VLIVFGVNRARLIPMQVMSVAGKRNEINHAKTNGRQQSRDRKGAIVYYLPDCSLGVAK
jgi:hypothetical protein